MGVIVVETIEDGQVTSSVAGSATVVEDITYVDTTTDVVKAVSTVDVVREGGAVTNVLWGYGLPSNPYEGQIWIDVS